MHIKQSGMCEKRREKKKRKRKMMDSGCLILKSDIDACISDLYQTEAVPNNQNQLLKFAQWSLQYFIRVALFMP
jgi:hypothetical protein